LRSSNFVFWAAVWDAAKSCNGVIALRKRFYWDSPTNPRGESIAIPPTLNKGHKSTNPSNLQNGDTTKLNAPRDRRHSAMVDIVSENGLEWVKVATTTEKRMIFDMAKAGWVGDSSSSDGSDEDHQDDDDEPDGLLKQAQALLRASRATRIRYRHPSIRIILPRIQRGSVQEIDQILRQVEALGITVQTSEYITAPLPFKEVLPRLAVNQFSGFTGTVNIDCTLLLAFVSDLSHGRVAPEDWHHRAILRQIKMESEAQLLPSSLWPACGSRKLVCTRAAAQRMQEIVDLIGTESEKKRSSYLMDAEGTKAWTRKERVTGFQELSAYDVPQDWALPIIVVEPDIAELLKSLPPIANHVVKQLTDINQSVFLYGWANKITTASSNRTVSKEIEAIIEANRSTDTDEGPDVWLCPTARSLVGKEKSRRDA
jgi:hypothetical protein